MNDSRNDRILELILFCFILIFSSWFFSPGSWAQVSRADMIFAAADHGTLRIDSYLTDLPAGHNTGDWSRSPDGHYYSNKAPGQGLLGIPVLMGIRAITKLCGIAPSVRVDYISLWLVNIAVSALPAALAGVFLFRLLLLLGHSRTRSLFFAAAGIMATPVFLYSSSLFAHSLSASLLFCALYAFEKDRGGKGCCTAGFLAGWAVLTDYLALPAAGFFLIYAFLKKQKNAVFFASGAIIPALIYCWYHWTCFGNPFLPATFYNNPVFTQNESALSLPSTIKMLKLLISSQRGLLFAFPILIAAIPGGIVMWKKERRTRGLLLLMFSWIFSGLLINASFNGWHGGHCVGPRYLIYSIPAWVIPASFCTFKGVLSRYLLLLGTGLSFANGLAASFSSLLISTNYMNPFTGIIYKLFVKGIIPVSEETWVANYALHLFSKDTFEGRLVGTPFRLIGVSDSRIETLFLLLILFLFIFLMDLYGGGFSTALKKLFHDTVEFFTRKRDIAITFNGIVITVGLLFLFLLPGNVPFVLDEPKLIAMASVANAKNLWCTHGLVGSLMQAYGPVPACFYQILLMFTYDPVLLVILKTAILGAGCVFLLFLIEKEAGFRYHLLPALALVSPWFWHYSRVLWDNVFLIPFSAWILYSLIRYLKTEYFPWIISAAAATVIAVWTHPMILPTAGGLAFFFLLIRFDLLKKQAKMLISTGAVSMLLLIWILLPKMLSAVKGGTRYPVEKLSLPESFLTGCGCFETILLPQFRHTFLSGYDEYGILPVPAISVLEYLSCAAACVLFLAGVFFLFRNFSRKNIADQAACFSLFVILSHIMMALYLRIPFYRHYNTMGVLIPGLFLLAYGAWELQQHCSRVEKTAEKVLLLCSLFVIAVCIVTIDLNGGDDTVQYGSTLSDQMKIACKIRETALGDETPLVMKHAENVRSHLPFSLTVCYFLKRQEAPRSANVPEGYSVVCYVFYTGEKHSGFIDAECKVLPLKIFTTPPEKPSHGERADCSSGF